MTKTLSKFGMTNPWTGRIALASVVVVTMVALTVGFGATGAHAAPPTCSGSSMQIVAHPDDDLLFQGTTVEGDISAGQCIRTVYVTAGDDNRGETYWQSRQKGVKAAYAKMADVANNWSTSDAGIAGHPMSLATLTADPKVSLVFMNLPDGQMNGSGSSNNNFESLQKLYQHVISTITTVDGSSSYTEDSLISTLTTLMNDFRPTAIDTQDFNGTFGGGDHSDHYAVAYFTVLAQQNYTKPAGYVLSGYMGYPIADDAVNLTSEQQQTKKDVFFTYAAFDTQTCDSVTACAGRPEESWFARQYTVGAATTPPTPPAVPAVRLVPEGDLAREATATASSENSAGGQDASAAIDGVITGYPGDQTKEWATQGGQVGSWLNLAWSPAVTLDKVVLNDRPNLDDQVTGATLTFSDGSTVKVSEALTNDDSDVAVTFPARTTTSLRLSITSVSSTTLNVGLAEIQAYAPESTPPPSGGGGTGGTGGSSPPPTAGSGGSGGNGSSSAPTPGPFSDVPAAAPFASAITWLKAQKITTGYADGTFRPMTDITREALAAFLYRKAHHGDAAPAPKTAPFRDVRVTSPFAGAIAWLKAQKITTGYADGTFRPTTDISREAVAAFLYRLDNGGRAAPQPTTRPFSDISVTAHFSGEIAWMKAQKITTGYPDGTFRPTTDISREAVAAFLYRSR